MRRTDLSKVLAISLLPLPLLQHSSPHYDASALSPDPSVPAHPEPQSPFPPRLATAPPCDNSITSTSYLKRIWSELSELQPLFSKQYIPFKSTTYLTNKKEMVIYHLFQGGKGNNWKSKDLILPILPYDFHVWNVEEVETLCKCASSSLSQKETCASSWKY